MKPIYEISSSLIEKLKTSTECEFDSSIFLPSVSNMLHRMISGESINKNIKIQDEEIPSFSEAFKSIIPQFIKYSPFINNHATITYDIKKLSELNQPFSKFLSEIRLNPDFKGNDLGSLLIRPVQRIPRYVLLIESLLNNTPEGHKEYQTLKECYEMIIDVADEINYNRSLWDSHIVLNSIHMDFPKISESTLKLKDNTINYELKGRLFLKRGQLKIKIDILEKEWKVCRAYLFSDILLLKEVHTSSPEKKRYKAISPLGSLLTKEDINNTFNIKSSQEFYIHMSISSIKKHTEQIFELSVPNQIYLITGMDSNESIVWFDKIFNTIEKEKENLKSISKQSMEECVRNKLKLRNERENQIEKMNQEILQLAKKYSQIFSGINQGEDRVDSQMDQLFRFDKNFVGHYFPKRTEPVVDMSSFDILHRKVREESRELKRNFAFSKKRGSFSENEIKIQDTRERSLSLDLSIDLEEKKPFEKPNPKYTLKPKIKNINI